MTTPTFFELKKMRRESYRVIRRQVALNFGTGFIPIPYADAPIMMGIQQQMLKQLTTIYQVDINEHQVETALSSTLGLLGAVVGGKALASSLLKLVPGAGTLLGGMISGSVGAAITTALGFAYCQLMEAVRKGSFDLTKATPDDITRFLVAIAQAKLPHTPAFMNFLTK